MQTEHLIVPVELDVLLEGRVSVVGHIDVGQTDCQAADDQLVDDHADVQATASRVYFVWDKNHGC